MASARGRKAPPAGTMSNRPNPLPNGTTLIDVVWLQGQDGGGAMSNKINLLPNIVKLLQGQDGGGPPQLHAGTGGGRRRRQLAAGA